MIVRSEWFYERFFGTGRCGLRDRSFVGSFVGVPGLMKKIEVKGVGKQKLLKTLHSKYISFPDLSVRVIAVLGQLSSSGV